MPLPIDVLDHATIRPYRIYDGPAIGADAWVALDAQFEAAWWFRCGGVTIRHGGQTWRARVGDWMFLGPGPREQRFDAGCELLSINYRWSDHLGRPVWSLVQPLRMAAGETAALCLAATTLAAIAAGTVGNPAYLLPPLQLTPQVHLRLRHAFDAWLLEAMSVLEAHGQMAETMPAKDARVTAARHQLDAVGLADSPDHDAIAAALGLSRTRLERLFRAAYGLSPHAYVERRRADLARAELLVGRRPIKEIAAALGFRHLSRFSTWFSRREGRPPREFRRLGPST